MGEDPLQTARSCRQYVKPLKIWNWSSFRHLYDQNRVGGGCYFTVNVVGEHEGVFTAADRGFQRFFKAVNRNGI